MMYGGKTDSMEPDENFSKIGDYVVVKTLGAGATAKVKLIYNIKGFYAAKILDPLYVQQNGKKLEQEANILMNLDHPNIVKLVDAFGSIDYVKKYGKTLKVTAFIFENVSGGELFDYLYYTGAFSENIARTYFRALIDCVKYCHGKGVTHRDLKPENILLDENYNLKIADFGYSTCIFGKDGSGELMSYVGTEAYMAPEMLERKSYNGEAVDVFSCGIILFIMMNRDRPFEKATSSDRYYKHFWNNQFDTFWELHEKNRSGGFNNKKAFSSEFKDLIVWMLVQDPSMRAKISDIENHPWFNGPTVSFEEIQGEFTKRKKMIDEILEKKKSEKAEMKKMAALQQEMAANTNNNFPQGIFTGFKPWRGGETETDIEEELDREKVDLTVKRKIKKYNRETGFKPMTEIFSLLDPRELLIRICFTCKDSQIDYEASKRTFKIKCMTQTGSGTCTFNILITKVDEKTNCIELHRTGGDDWEFREIVERVSKDFSKKIQEEEEVDDQDN